MGKSVVEYPPINRYTNMWQQEKEERWTAFFTESVVRRYEDKQVEKRKVDADFAGGYAGTQRVQPAAVGILCGDESGKDQSAFQSDALCGMCRRTRRIVIVPVYRKEGLIASGFCAD